MKYNEIYQKNNAVWGDDPNPLLKMIFDRVDIPASFLDLGCGQGRDSIFMLKNGFNVISVDESYEGVDKILEIVKNNQLFKDRINLFCLDVKDFDIKKNEFSIINVYNLFHFMKKEDVLLIIEKIRKGLISGGYIVLSGFLKTNSVSQKKQNDKGFFQEGELKKLFFDFDMIFYEEKVIDDPGHSVCPNPHQHYIVKMVTQKL